MALIRNREVIAAIYEYYDFYRHQTKPDLNETRAAADRLAANQACIYWLPQVRDMQTYLIISLERQVDRAERVLDILIAYAEVIGDPKQSNIE